MQKQKLMFNSKLISVRIDSEVLNKIDAFAGGARYYNRSVVINRLLRAAVDAAIWGDGKPKNIEKNLWNLRFDANFVNR